MTALRNTALPATTAARRSGNRTAFPMKTPASARTALIPTTPAANPAGRSFRKALSAGTATCPTAEGHESGHRAHPVHDPGQREAKLQQPPVRGTLRHRIVRPRPQRRAVQRQGASPGTASPADTNRKRALHRVRRQKIHGI